MSWIIAGKHSIFQAHCLETGGRLSVRYPANTYFVGKVLLLLNEYYLEW